MALVPASIKALPTSGDLALEDLTGRIETMKKLLTTGYHSLEEAIRNAESLEGENERLVLVPYNKGYFEIGRPHLGGVHLPLPCIGFNFLWREKSRKEFIFEMARRYHIWIVEMSTFLALRLNTGRSFFMDITGSQVLIDSVGSYYSTIQLNDQSSANSAQNIAQAKRMSCHICQG